MNVKPYTELVLNDKRPWLIVGKGPSFEKIYRDQKYYFEEFNVAGLNQVNTYIHTELAFFNDYEAFTDTKIMSPRCTLVMNFTPHFRCRPGHGTLLSFAGHDYRLRKYVEAGRVFGYDIPSSAAHHMKPAPIVPSNHSVCEAAMGVLVNLGIKQINLLGVDYGHSRHSLFNTRYYDTCEEINYDLQRDTLHSFEVKAHNLGVE